MPNEDHTQQPTNSTSQQIAQLVAVVRSLEDRVIGIESRLANVEEIIVARLNTTRPLDQEVLARLNDLTAGQAIMQEQMVTMQKQMIAMQDQMVAMQDRMVAMQEQIVAMRADLTALRLDHERFREETNRNFKLVNQKLEHLNNDFLSIRAEHTLLEERVSRLEEAA